MPRYTIDGTLTFASQVEADTAQAAAAALRDALDGFEPNLTLPVWDRPQVASATITEISLGTLREGAPQADLWLVAVDDEPVAG
jgi:hypothetical protein